MRTLFTCGLVILWFYSSGQILFSESFTVILDSTKLVKGSITPELKIQTQKELLVEFTNRADLTVRMKKNSLTIANKVEFTSFGKEVFLSGGYLYGKFKNNLDKHFSLEGFGQVHWAEARGLSSKLAVGGGGRYKIIKKSNTGLFFGTGPFLEYEKWDYSGVIDENLPVNLDPIDTLNVKLNTYISYKHALTKKIFVDMSLYHQSRFDEVFFRPRLAASLGVSYSITSHIQFVALYQNIYDYAPIVPIDPWFHRFTGTVAFGF